MPTPTQAAWDDTAPEGAIPEELVERLREIRERWFPGYKSVVDQGARIVQDLRWALEQIDRLSVAASHYAAERDRLRVAND